MDPRTGNVLAMVGGRDYWGPEPYARYNLAMGKGRQSGSSFKPLVLAAALEAGLPIIRRYSGPGAISIPRDQAPNWNVKGGCGQVTLVEATVASCNTVYAQLIMDIGGERAVEMAHRLGVVSELQDNEAAVLGTNDVTTVDMATAFGAFANHGIQVDPVMVTRIVNADGTVLYEHEYQQEKALAAPVADLVTLEPRAGRRAGHGHRRPAPRPAGGGQDRHHRELLGRLVRRLHAPAGHRGVGRASPSNPSPCSRPRRRSASTAGPGRPTSGGR